MPMIQVTNGCCLCGTVRFQISGEFESFFQLSLHALSKGCGVSACGQLVFVDRGDHLAIGI